MRRTAGLIGRRLGLAFSSPTLLARRVPSRRTIQYPALLKNHHVIFHHIFGILSRVILALCGTRDITLEALAIATSSGARWGRKVTRSSTSLVSCMVHLTRSASGRRRPVAQLVHCTLLTARIHRTSGYRQILSKYNSNHYVFHVWQLIYVIWDIRVASQEFTVNNRLETRARLLHPLHEPADIFRNSPA